MNIQSYSPAAHQHSGVGMTDPASNYAPRMDQQNTEKMNAGVTGGLNFDTNLGSAQSTAQNLNAIMGSTAAQGINFLDNDPISQNVSQNTNQAMNDMGMGANSQNDQMLHLMSMLQNVVSLLMNMVTNNNNNSQNAQNNQSNPSSESSANDTGIDYDGSDDYSNSSDSDSYGDSSGSPATNSGMPRAASQNTNTAPAPTPSNSSSNSETSTAEPTTHAAALIANARAAAAEQNQTTTAPSGTTTEATAPEATSGTTPATDNTTGVNSTAKSSNITTTPSSQADFEQHFETEGNSPYQADGSQVFDAFASDVRTENGNGIRGENKIKEEDRVSMAESNESFSATVTPDLSPGSQAIISQWHGQDEGALVKLYVDDQAGDVQTAGAENGVAGDGIFDVYTVYKDADGEQHRINHGTITEGESLDVNFEKNGNDFSANVNGVSADFSVTDDPEVYFKYGMYLQTKDPITGEKAQPNDGGMEILERNNITQASAIFENASFTREIV